MQKTRNGDKSVDLVMKEVWVPEMGEYCYEEELPEGSRKQPLLLCIWQTARVLRLSDECRDRFHLRVSRKRPPQEAFVLRLEYGDYWVWSNTACAIPRFFFVEARSALMRLTHELGVRSPKPGTFLDLWLQVRAVEQTEVLS